jgi:propionyl-CoA synthetase
MLACAKIGATHVVVFGGFSAKELANRIVDSNPKIIICANAGK